MSQHALVLSQIGKDLHLTTRPIPDPAANEILVNIEIAGLNPHDAKSKSTGLFVENTLPTPLAIEFAGTISKLGPGVTKFAVGEMVVGFGNAFNPDFLGTQQYALLRVNQASRIPKNVSLDEALTFPLNAQTVWYALFDASGFGLPPPLPQFEQNFDYSKNTIVIVGGGSATGKFAIEFARMAGFQRIVTIASSSKEAQLKDLGATHVIDRKQSHDEIEEAVRAITGDTLLYVLDCVHYGTEQTLGARFLSTAQRGTLVTIIRSGNVDETQFKTPKKAGYERKFVFCDALTYQELCTSFFDNLVGWVEKGELKPTTWSVIEGLNSEKINEVLDAYNIQAANAGGVTKPHIHFS